MSFIVGSSKRLKEIPPPPLFTELLKELSKDVAGRWELVGALINIEVGVLERIKNDNQGNSQMCFYTMLKEWMKKVDPPPAWPTIIDAIDILGDVSLAENLRHKYVK